MFEVHGSGTVMRQTPHVVPQSVSTVPLCTITGVITRPDGSLVSNGTVTFDPRVPQTISGSIVLPALVSATTDMEGDLQAIALIRGLFVQIVVSDNGITYPPMNGVIPNQATATFSQIVSGIVGAGGGGGGGEVSPGTGFPTSAPVWVWNAGRQAWTTLPTTAGVWGWDAAAQRWVLL